MRIEGSGSQPQFQPSNNLTIQSLQQEFLELQKSNNSPLFGSKLENFQKHLGSALNDTTLSPKAKETLKNLHKTMGEMGNNVANSWITGQDNSNLFGAFLNL